MYVKVVISLLALVGMVIAAELGMLARLASHQNAGRARAAALADMSVPLDRPRASNDVTLDRVIGRIDIPSMTLERAFAEFERQAKVKVLFYRAGHIDSLTEDQLNTAVELHLHEVPVADALEALLKQLGPEPEWGVRGDFLTVGEPGDMEVRLYDVRSLVPLTYPPPDPPAQDRDRTNEDLIKLILSCVATDSWRENGGTGNISYWGGILIIRQTAARHREVARFLSNLKQAHPDGSALPRYER